MSLCNISKYDQSQTIQFKLCQACIGFWPWSAFPNPALADLSCGKCLQSVFWPKYKISLDSKDKLKIFGGTNSIYKIPGT